MRGAARHAFQNGVNTRKGLPLPVAIASGSNSNRPAEQAKLHVPRPANAIDGLFEFRLPGLVAARGMDCLRAGLIDETGEHLRRSTAP